MPAADHVESARRYRASLRQDTSAHTVEQNILFRWVSEADLPEFIKRLIDRLRHRLARAD